MPDFSIFKLAMKMRGAFRLGFKALRDKVYVDYAYPMVQIRHFLFPFYSRTLVDTI